MLVGVGVGVGEKDGWEFARLLCYSNIYTILARYVLIMNRCMRVFVVYIVHNLVCKVTHVHICTAVKV
jgi:hypothetical protein